MKIMTAICLVIFFINIILTILNAYIKDKWEENLSPLMGWLCAFLWCLMAALNNI